MALIRVQLRSRANLPRSRRVNLPLWGDLDCLAWSCSCLFLFADILHYNDSSLFLLLDSHISRSAAVLSHLTCDSPNLASEKSPNETGHMRPEADPDEVEVVEFAPLFLKTVFVDMMDKI